jgi:hypothetical protein
MANERSVLDEVEVKDLEDGSALRVRVEACSELGNYSKPGLQVHFLGYIVNFEPNIAERWNYQAKKAGGGPLLLDQSWTAHTDQFVKVYYVPAAGNATPKARIEVKSRTSDNPVAKEYALPFSF